MCIRDSISIDELRGITIQFKEEISKIKSPFYVKIEEIRSQIKSSEDIDENESRYKKIEEAVSPASKPIQIPVLPYIASLPR